MFVFLLFLANGKIVLYVCMCFKCVCVCLYRVCLCVSVLWEKLKENSMCGVQKSFLDGAHNTKGLRRKTVLCDSENWAEASQTCPAREQSSELKVAIREHTSEQERERHRRRRQHRRRHRQSFRVTLESFRRVEPFNFRFHSGLLVGLRLELFFFIFTRSYYF